MGAKADEYRRKADECERLANQAKDAEAKRNLRQAADSWREMASVAERHGW
jgi:hypothetical protein